MGALHEVFGRHGHVVTQIVETEFVVRTEGNIGLVGAATGFRVGLMLVDAVYAQAMEHIDGAHPFRVTLGQIVIDCYYVNTVTRQGIEEYREGSYEGFTFTGSHFGNFTLVQYDTTEELHVVVYHVPLCVISTGYPVVLVDSFVAFNTYKIVRGGQLAVKIVGRYLYFWVFSKAAGCTFYDGKGFGKGCIEFYFIALQYFLFYFVDLVENQFAVFQRCVFNLGFQLLNLGFQVVSGVLNFLLQLFCLCSELIVVELVDGFVGFLYLFNNRLNQLHVAC